MGRALQVKDTVRRKAGGAQEKPEIQWDNQRVNW